MVVAKHAMIQHQRKVIQAKDEEDTQSVYIRRKLLYSDAFKAFSRPSFNVSKMLKVTFIGEGAVDDGGPRREFFSILMRDTFAKSGLFCGSPENVLPIHSIQGVGCCRQSLLYHWENDIYKHCPRWSATFVLFSSSSRFHCV